MEKIKVDIGEELKKVFDAIYLSVDEQDMVVVELDFKDTVEDKQALIDCIGVQFFKDFLPDILGSGDARLNLDNGIQIREYKGE